jgi:cyclopropane-fatty-acyl-phospholipid synthase
MTSINDVQNKTFGASPEAIQYHYDLSNEFYRLWLDGSLMYSAALWDENVPNDSLEAAQLRKIDYHIHQAKAAQSGRVLDVGCGWGGLLKRLVEVYSVKQAVGLTLSPAQAEWIKSFQHPQIQVSVESWADHNPAEPYDAIISIGAFEHFATLEMSSVQKVQGYRAFFRRCQEFLKPGGWMSLQTFAYGNIRYREEARKLPATQFLARDIFPETDPPCLVDIVEAVGGIFEVVMLRNDRQHYARTCRIWLENLRAQRAAAEALVGPEVVTRYERYLQLSAIGFESGGLNLFRISLHRINKQQK